MTTKPLRNSPLSSDAIETLRSAVSGTVTILGDAGYESAHSIASFTYGGLPAAVVSVDTEHDVSQAVLFARRHDLPLAVRGGGHSMAGFSAMDGSLVVDLRRLAAVEVDAVRQSARVQGGARSIDLAILAHEHGLALSTGDTGTVGLGGLVTGGGIGWFVRRYGLAADRLISARIVTADGALVTASESEHHDLFWAIRGGGGNFGIVVEFEFQLVPVKHVTGGALVVPATREAVRSYLDYSLNAPDELSTSCSIMLAPEAPFIPENRLGERVLHILAVWSGDPAAADAALAPLIALGDPVANTIDQIPYPAMFDYGFEEIAHGAAVRHMFADELTDDAIDSFLAAVDNSVPGGMSLVELRGLGGQLARVPANQAAFPHRQRNYFVALVDVWFDPEEDATRHRAWTEDLWARVAHLRSGVYVNFLQREGEARVHEAYPGDTYARLAQVKADYDPDNVFRFNQNLKPAVGENRAAA